MEPDMSVKVCKHGNSLSIRLGAHIAHLANLKAGDYVNVLKVEALCEVPSSPLCPPDSDASGATKQSNLQGSVFKV